MRQKVHDCMGRRPFYWAAAGEIKRWQPFQGRAASVGYGPRGAKALLGSPHCNIIYRIAALAVKSMKFIHSSMRSDQRKGRVDIRPPYRYVTIARLNEWSSLT